MIPFCQLHCIAANCLFLWLTISSFQIFIALPVCSAFSKVQSAHHSLFSQLVFFLPQVYAKLICLLLTDSEQFVGTAFMLPALLQKQLSPKHRWHCLQSILASRFTSACDSCVVFCSSTICVPHVAILTQCFQHCFLWIISISCRQSLCLFPPIIYGCSQHWALNAQRRGPGSKSVSNTPSPGFPFCSSVKGTSALADRGIHAVGSGRWAAEEQCHLPPTPASPGTPRNAGTTAPLHWWHGQDSPCPYLAIGSGGILSLWGFPGQGGRCGLAPSGQHQVYMTWMHICPHCCFASCFLTAVAPTNLSLWECVKFKKKKIDLEGI